MNNILLKHTDLLISPLAFGTAQFGNKYDKQQSFHFLDAYVDAGGNLIDTALAYSSSISDESRSEKIIGEWMSKLGNRNHVVLATKGCHPRYWDENLPRFSKKDLFKDIDQSLKNLKTDYVDLYWIHKDDPTKPVDEVLDGMNEIVKSGKARFIGISNMAADRMDLSLNYMKSAFAIVFTIALMLSFIVIFFPKMLFGIFTSDNEVINACMLMIPLIVLIFMGSAVRSPNNGLIDGSGNFKLNIVVALFDGIINRIGFGLLFGLAMGMGWIGFLYGDAVAGFTPLLIGSIYYFSGKWRTRKYIIK